MIWIKEIEPAKCIAELKTSHSITGAQLQTNFEVPDSKIARWSQEDHQRRLQRRVLIQEEAAQKEKRFLTGKEVAWIIYE